MSNKDMFIDYKYGKIAINIHNDIILIIIIIIDFINAMRYVLSFLVILIHINAIAK